MSRPSIITPFLTCELTASVAQVGRDQHRRAGKRRAVRCLLAQPNLWQEGCLARENHADGERHAR